MVHSAFMVGAFQRQQRNVLACVLFWLGVNCCAAPALAQSGQNTDPDLKVAGASAQLGLGGGFFPNAWSELRLEAHAPGAYRLELQTAEGVRNGRSTVRALLEVEDGPGVRSSRLRLPLFSVSPVHLRLVGPGGENKVVLEPFESGLILSNSSEAGLDSGTGQSLRSRLEVYGPDLRPDPALWLGANQLRLSANATPVSESLALAWLAAGGQIQAGAGTPGMERVPSGSLGLGSFAPDALGQNSRKDGTTKRINLNRIALAFEPSAPIITWPGSRYGFWALGAFIACLIAWRFGQSQPNVVLSSAVIAVVFGLIGMLAWRPSLETQSSKRLLIGTGGWGLELQVKDVPVVKPGEVRLEVGARPMLETAGTRTYLSDATVLTKPAWSRVRYWLPPTARVVPLRIQAGQMSHSIPEPLQDVFVVGFGLQEPMTAGLSRKVKKLETRLPQGLEALIELLPDGAVIARTKLAVYVALPEGS
jgi:hypothetical protein